MTETDAHGCHLLGYFSKARGEEEGTSKKIKVLYVQRYGKFGWRTLYRHSYFLYAVLDALSPSSLLPSLFIFLSLLPLLHPPAGEGISRRLQRGLHSHTSMLPTHGMCEKRDREREGERRERERVVRMV